MCLRPECVVLVVKICTVHFTFGDFLYYAPCYEVYVAYFYYRPIPVAAWSKAWVCGRPLSGIVDLNPAGSMDVCLL
jgi:hypothetical protein